MAGGARCIRGFESWRYVLRGTCRGHASQRRSDDPGLRGQGGRNGQALRRLLGGELGRHAPMRGRYGPARGNEMLRAAQGEGVAGGNHLGVEP